MYLSEDCSRSDVTSVVHYTLFVRYQVQFIAEQICTFLSWT